MGNVDEDEQGEKRGGEQNISLDRFIELLQALITMTDPEDMDEMKYAKEVLRNLNRLAGSSMKVTREVLRTMMAAYAQFDMLMQHKSEFAGRPGDYAANDAKRHRLAMTIRPGC